MTGRTLWVGTYPAAGQGTPTGLGEGIWRISLDPAPACWATRSWWSSRPRRRSCARGRPRPGCSRPTRRRAPTAR
ncbi:hypothetical protein [Tessaracoccus coleopterorum]|uniref:hypothetical protein n=1 Tax=Tessaracoccus coleopterorum TaxID=2714950 RepID=UPI0018D482F4|nr:hypothetical protein [Tessaracoccus coleopterorum]